MKWVGQLVYTWEMRNAYRIFVGKLDRKIPLEDMGIDVRIILKQILGKWG
jgi:hypothetical protein